MFRVISHLQAFSAQISPPRSAGFFSFFETLATVMPMSPARPPQSAVDSHEVLMSCLSDSITGMALNRHVSILLPPPPATVGHTCLSRYFYGALKRAK